MIFSVFSGTVVRIAICIPMVQVLTKYFHSCDCLEVFHVWSSHVFFTSSLFKLKWTSKYIIQDNKYIIREVNKPKANWGIFPLLHHPLVLREASDVLL